MHHGLPDFIASLGAAVISEDALPRNAAGQHMDTPLRARNQWTYPARMYRAALWAAEADHGGARVEIVQLTSFGCGIDAVTADQMRELLRAHAFGGFAVGPQAHKGSYPDWLRHWPSP